ncbi:uncharacterized protein LOC105685055 isoform X1 [Athalia rosae]|uniref:uncharacterized protein LOC105685055 isoform X1 n=2 Tax=Athalia rosae TaxID=37344 RepID=UPI00203424AD|nr:uncharacterized protein LOC105685055 isoform X1 [Athalia rosae]
MVDTSEEHVLQWEGHASHVTERFSGLLARQSLVDVTLICEGQGLRVHKLVLASCSPYFEEMLEQDLGQEPTILLSDLNFEVLKAMVEFMYCGETSISKQHLQPLLQAARVFKVKELAWITKNLMAIQSDAADQDRNSAEFSEEEVDDLEDGNEYSLFNDNSYMQTPRWSNIHADEYSERDLDKLVDRKVGPTCDNKLLQSQVSLSSTDMIDDKKVTDVFSPVDQNLIHESQKITDSVELEVDDNVFIDKENELQPVLYEQCCDFVNTKRMPNESVKVPSLITESCPEEECETIKKPSREIKEVTRTVDKCLKVYTHKRRTSIEGIDKHPIKIIDDRPEPPITSNCIDLMEEPSKYETELESEYIMSLSNGNIETVIGFIGNDISDERVYNSRVSDEVPNPSAVNHNKEARQMKEIFPGDNRIVPHEQSDDLIRKSKSLCTPTLRRSVRLSHHEHEDATNNNNTNSIQDTNDKTKEKPIDSRNGTEISRRFKRRHKEAELYCESDENKASPDPIIRGSDPPRFLRSNSKLIARRGSRAHLSLSKNNNKGEQKVKTANKLKSEKIIRSGSVVESSDFLPNKFNTIATVSRALWGDMSDYLENTNNDLDYSDYSPSKEIPFAVGLLPLRAALERMQAMPDYQPRKTRSSVTPLVKHELNGVKRRNSGSNVETNSGGIKRQNTHSQANNLDGNTVCHVHITTSHSQSVRTRRRFSPEHVQQVATTAISPTNIDDRQ